MVEKAKINLYARFSFEAKAEQPVITLTGILDKTKWGFEQEIAVAQQVWQIICPCPLICHNGCINNR
jgi:hypothetical protein